MRNPSFGIPVAESQLRNPTKQLRNPSCGILRSCGTRLYPTSAGHRPRGYHLKPILSVRQGMLQTWPSLQEEGIAKCLLQGGTVPDVKKLCTTHWVECLGAPALWLSSYSPESNATRFDSLIAKDLGVCFQHVIPELPMVASSFTST